MFNSMSPSLADIAAVTGNRNNDGWGNGNGWWILIILFALFGWGRGGYGNEGSAQGALTRGDLCMDMNFNGLQNDVRGLAADMQAGFRTIDNAVCTLGYNNAQLANGIQMQISNEFRGLDNNVCRLGYDNAQLVNGLSRQLSDCCCQTQRAIESNFAQTNFNMAQQNCATLTAIDKVGDRIIDFMSAEKMQTLRDENQALRLAASQAQQNNYLVQQLRPAPIPSFQVPNPYCYSGCYGWQQN